MRLAIVRRRFASAGGAESFIAGAAASLAALGAQVTLVAEGVEGVKGDAGQWLRLPRSRGSRSARYRAFQQAVADALSKNDFDIVQAHERILGAHVFRAGDGVHAAWVERLKRERPAWRRPFLSLDPYHRLLMETERRMAEEGETVFVANSAMVGRELAHWLKIPPRRLRLIENGVDLSRFRPPDAEEREAARRRFGLRGSEIAAAFVGSGFERKGAFAFVEALADKRLTGVRALLAGRDKHAAALLRLARRLDVAHRVTMLGALDDVRPVLHAADLFVLPTLYDPMPNAALEAVACGLPVVTTADAGIADHIRETGAGALATRRPADIAEAIEDVTARLDDAGEAATRLRARFDIDWKAREWLKLYRELA